MNFIIYIISIVYLLVPAAFANMVPVFVKNYFKALAFPVDFNTKFEGSRLFGSHKTFRGFIFGILASIIVVIIQVYLYQFSFFKDISFLDYSKLSAISFGFLVGFGVLFGDLIGSFIKRRLRVRPGRSFLILDQINSAVGYVIFVIPFYFKSWTLAFWVIIIWVLGHFVLRYLGYILKITKEKI